MTLLGIKRDVAFLKSLKPEVLNSRSLGERGKSWEKPKFIFENEIVCCYTGIGEHQSRWGFYAISTGCYQRIGREPCLCLHGVSVQEEIRFVGRLLDLPRSSFSW